MAMTERKRFVQLRREKPSVNNIEICKMETLDAFLIDTYRHSANGKSSHFYSNFLL